MFISKKRFNEIIDKINQIDNKITAVDIAKSFVNRSDYFPVITKENAPPLSDNEKKKVAYALNLCTVSVSQIIDYNDIYILEQEYDAILNNLNLQNFIKDESLLKVLKQMLDTITFFRIQEGDKIFIEKEYQQKMKNAIWSAVPNLSIIFTGGNPISMAIAAAAQIGIGYMNYRKNKNQYALDKEKQEWELQRSAIEQFNGLRRELFEAAWRLSDAYDFDDKYRITEKQISRYNIILLDPDPLRRFEKLNVISDTFKAFPPFWYYKANAAKDIYKSDDFNEKIKLLYKEKAIEAYREFDKTYVYFMREDVIAASCALEHISLLDVNKDKDEITKLLERAIELAGDNFDVLQICVLTYVALNKFEDAKNVLQKLINEDYNISLNGLLLSRIYFKIDKNKEEYDILERKIGRANVMPWFESDLDADKGYIEYRKNNVVWRFDMFLSALFNKHQNILNNNINYNKYYDNYYEEISWFNNIDLIDLIINSLNQLFDELTQLNIFIIQKREDNYEWSDFFKNKALSIKNTLIKFNENKNNVEKYISQQTLHDVLKNHKENKAMCLKINELIKKNPFEKCIYDMFDELKIEFNRPV